MIDINVILTHLAGSMFSKRNPKKQDILAPSLTPGYYGHVSVFPVCLQYNLYDELISMPDNPTLIKMYVCCTISNRNRMQKKNARKNQKIWKFGTPLKRISKNAPWGNSFNDWSKRKCVTSWKLTRPKWRNVGKSIESLFQTERVLQTRWRLQELLSQEERQYYFDTVNAAQKGTDQKLEEMKVKAEMLKAKRETERLQLVHEKRLEQYR